MKTKLTSTLENNVVQKVNDSTVFNNIDLSKIGENNLHSLAKQKNHKVSPLVESLTGVISVQEDYRKGYTKYLTKKYFLK